jgi:hypothetical protein
MLSTRFGRLICCALVALPLSAQARGLPAAIFHFEFIDTSLEGEMNGPRADETTRLIRLGEQLRALVTKSGIFPFLGVHRLTPNAMSDQAEKGKGRRHCRAATAGLKIDWC